MAKYRSPLMSAGTMTTPFKKKGAWRAGYHTGEDWISKTGNRQLVSPCNGSVSFVGYDSNGYGNYLIIHADDKKCILMAHFANTPVVKKGEKVSVGQKVGTMGTTGNSTGVHLHIEVENSVEWNYAKNLLKPSDYIDFSNYKGEMSVTDVQAKSWKNGSTVEKMYFTTADASKRKNAFYTFSKKQSAWCYAVVSGKYLVTSKRTLTKERYVGLVNYSGTVANFSAPQFAWKNKGARLNTYANAADCRKGRNAIGYLYPYEQAVCYGKYGGCYIIVYSAGGAKKAAFVNYSGGVK